MNELFIICALSILSCACVYLLVCLSDEKALSQAYCEQLDERLDELRKEKRLRAGYELRVKYAKQALEYDEFKGGDDDD